MKLVLGVIDIPYANAPRSLRAKKVRAGEQTTGDVAGWLENKYGVMAKFYEKHQADVAAAIENSVHGAVESLLMGKPQIGFDAFNSATSKIEDQFKQFLALKEIEAMGVPGVPTQAALRGVSRRKKHPYKRRAPRPSFLDTGLYSASFKAWVDKS